MLSRRHTKLSMLILSDLFILSGFGLIGPIFAVFITQNLRGGSLVAAGLTTTIFLIVKSSVQLPLSNYFIDKHDHKSMFLVVGTFLIVLVPFLYFLAKDVYLIFVAEAIYGLGAALAYPAWFSLFTLYTEAKHRGLEYSIYTTVIGISGALAAYFGARVAELLGFRTLFFVVGAISFIGFMFLIALWKMELKKSRRNPKHPFNVRQSKLQK